jgi:hypothetical protein
MFNPANFQPTLGMGGYAFTYSDATAATPGTSSVCINGSAFCAAGTIGLSPGYGGVVGVNLNQTPGTTALGTYAVPATAKGITYALSALPTGTVQLIVRNGPNDADDYFVTITAASGSVPWSMFRTTPWMPDASAPLGSAPQMATQVKSQVNAGARRTPSTSASRPSSSCKKQTA